MDQATIERLAQQAFDDARIPDALVPAKIDTPLGADHRGPGLSARFLREFARLVEAETAEQCAKLCLERQPKLERFDVQRATGNAARDCAGLIRSVFATGRLTDPARHR